MRNVNRLLAAMVLTAAIHHTAAARDALTVENVPDLYQRVLTIPGAELNQNSGGSFSLAPDSQLPVFTPLYVYGRSNDSDGNEWVEVGKRPKDQIDGWVKAQYLEEWRHQLVMQYMPRGRRQRVMFFDEAAALNGIIQSGADGIDRANDYIVAIESGAPLAQDIIAVEPWEAVDPSESMYLMPIFQFKQPSYVGVPGVSDVMLLQVAGLNLQETPADQQNEKLPPPPPPPPQQAEELADMKIGIVFVMDTTASMGDYIKQTYQTVETIYAELEQGNNLDRVSFGLVGYRDNMDDNAAIEYVTRIFQPLDPNADPADTLRNLEQVKPATTSTTDWEEDALAGVDVAVNQLNWDPFDVRFVVLVSDAGPRNPGEPLSALSEEDFNILKNKIDRDNIAVITLHLLTPGGSSNHKSGRNLYQSTLGGTGDPTVEKYIGVRQGSVEEFTRQITTFAEALQTTIAATGSGEVAEAPEPPPPAPRGRPAPPQDLGDILLSELFRAQLEYLGTERGVEAPRFYRAWAAELDLTNPKIDALDVNVLLTKDQLNTLAARLDDILSTLRAGDLDADEGWAALVELAGRFTTDPNRGDFVDIGSSGVLPGYLQELPYKSDFLTMTQEDWSTKSSSGRREIVRNLEMTTMLYQDLAQDDRIWIDLGAGDPNLSVFPIPLDELP